jgi:Crp-like helix-turn-helix domain
LRPRLLGAQAVGDRSDAGVDADDAHTDALLGTLNLATPAPFGNLYSTALGAEQQAVRPLESSGWTGVSLSMSRRVIADYLDLSVETVGRALDQLKARGAIVLTNRHHLAILDRLALDVAPPKPHL